MNKDFYKHNKIFYLFLTLVILMLPFNQVSASEKEELIELNSDEIVSVIVDGDISQFEKIREYDTKAKLIREFSIIDAFSCKVNKEILEDMRNLGIKYYIEDTYKKVEDNSTNLENMPINISNSVANEEIDSNKNISNFDGRGRVVAVLDSGVDVQHKDLQKTPTDAQLNYDKVVSIISEKNLKGKFFSEKVPYAYNYADNNEDIIDSNKSAIDYGHGMHVIGIIAADSENPNSGVTGVSKNAQVLSMKVFSNDPKDKGASTEGAVISAIEDSIALNADVINMSLTIPAGIEDLNRPMQRAVKAATDRGILVVAAAGNTAYSTYPKVMSDDPGTVGSPAIVGDALAVASYENEFVNASAFNHKGKDIIYSNIYGDISKISGEKIVDGGNGNPEEIPSNSDIVLMHRSGLQFVDMVKSAYDKGAKAVIFYNREGDKEYVMNVGELHTDIPVIFISYEDGMFLRENLDGVPDFTERLVKIENNDLGMSVFSSHGPSSDLSIKPEITAVGGKVYSLANENNYTVMSGTSMAAPYVSGIALNYMNFLDSKGIPKDPNYIKNAMMNTADIKFDASGNPYSITQQGAGMIDFQAMINQELMVTNNGKGKVELGQFDGSVNFDLNIKNLTSGTVDAKVSFSDVFTINKEKARTEILEGAKITVDNTNISVSQESDILNVNIDLNGAKQGFVEGYIFIESENTKVTIPYLGYNGDYSSLPVFDQNKYNADSIFSEQGLYAMIFDKSGYRYKLEAHGGAEMNPDYISINPDDRNAITNVIPKVSLLRNVKDFNIYVTNSDGEIIRYIDKQDSQRKASLYEERTFLSDELWAWHGNYYDKNQGEKVVADEGIYYYVIEATPIMEGSAKQVLKFPVKIDKVPPFVKSKTMVIDSNTIELEIEAEEKGDYKTDIKHFIFLVNGKGYKEDGEVIFNLEENNGVYKKTIKLDESLPNDFEIHVGASDYAGNMGIGTYNIIKKDDKLNFESDKSKYGINEDIELKFSHPNAKSYKILVDNKVISETEDNQTRIKFSELGDKAIIIEAYDAKNNRLALNSIIVNISKDLTESDIEVSSNNIFDDNRFTTEAKILNKYGEKKNITYITCVYDKNMKLLNTLSNTISLEGYDSASVSNDAYLPKGSYIIKNFVWDDFDNLNTIIEEESILIDGESEELDLAA